MLETIFRWWLGSRSTLADWNVILQSYRGRLKNMMTSSNGNIFRVTLCVWNSPVPVDTPPPPPPYPPTHTYPPPPPPHTHTHTHTPHTHIKGSDEELWFLLWSAWINSWANNRDDGDVRRHRSHYDVIVMQGFFHKLVCHETGLWTRNIFHVRFFNYSYDLLLVKCIANRHGLLWNFQYVLKRLLGITIYVHFSL